jgi:hypothetical protein
MLPCWVVPTAGSLSITEPVEELAVPVPIIFVAVTVKV